MTWQSATFEILLAEDNPADAMLVREALLEHGIQCNLHVIADGAETIAFIDQIDSARKPRLDLLLLDMHLPKCDGEEILSRLRATERNALTPVIVMTGSSAPSDRGAAQKHAALHYFTKPADLQGFMQLGVLVRDLLLRKKNVDTEPDKLLKEERAV